MIQADGTAYSIMVGTGEVYISAFVLAIGMGAITAGLVASIPLLIGAILQLFSGWGIRKLGSHKKWVVACATVQAIMFLPFIWGALEGNIAKWAVFLTASLYWGASLGTSAAWNTWVGTLVPRMVRSRFFARRTAMTQVGTLLSLLAGAVILGLGENRGDVLTAFGILFTTAMTARAASAAFLARQSEPVPYSGRFQTVGPMELIRRVGGRGDAKGVRLLLFVLFMTCSIQVSVPYFTPFMLKTLELSYFRYVILLATSATTKVLVLPLLGKIAHRFSGRTVLRIGAVGASIIPALWLLHDGYVYLVILQILAGIFWGAYELGQILSLFETIREEERTSILTSFNFLNSVSTVVGATLGSLLLSAHGSQYAGYVWIFLVSSAMRLASAGFLVGKGAAPARLVRTVGWRILGLRPSAGFLLRPILSSFHESEEKESPANDPSKKN